LDALDTNIEGQLQTLNETVNGNSTDINTLTETSVDIKTRVNYHRKALGDLGLGLALVGVTVETLQTNLDALDTNIEGQLQTLNETVGGNSTAITTLSDDTDTRFTHHRNALGDLGLGLGLVGVTVETLQTNLDALAAISLPDLAGYALETYVDGAVAAISLLDLAGYVLETCVDGAIAAISLPDLADPALEAHVNAIDACVEDNSAAIVNIENKLVVNSDELVVIDQTSFVIINNSPVFQTRTNLQAIHALDDDASTRRALNFGPRLDQGTGAQRVTALGSEFERGPAFLISRVDVGPRLDQNAGALLVTRCGSDHERGRATLHSRVDVGPRLDQGADARLVTA